GGQASPTTPFGLHTASSPYGHLEHPFDISKLVEAAGAPFVARSTVFHARALEKLIGRAIEKRGFSVVEVMSPCVTHYGKMTGMGSPVEMMQWQRDNSIPIEKAREMPADELKNKIVTGVLVDIEKPTFHEEHARLLREVK
ncbi:MAG: thiamine pyrophosphate-dependent enzyme, partial [Dehalococcoidia bacterium]|nr:thiamine pyrophosphate-dependent enzyme [Dehalococcoidia bacterium]